MTPELLIPVCVFGAVALMCYFLSSLVMTRGDGKIRDRLRHSPGSGNSQSSAAAPTSAKASIKSTFERFGQAAARPFMPSSREKQSGLRSQLSRAGIYSPQAIRLVTGCKVIFLGAGIIGGYVIGVAMDQMLLGVSVGGLLGYMLPVIWLKTAIKANQKALTYGLPDAIDLM